MNTEGWINIAPEQGGDIPTLARALLALAHVSSHVVSQGNGSEFLVPQYLADAYMTPPEAPKPRRRTKKEGDE